MLCRGGTPNVLEMLCPATALAQFLPHWASGSGGCSSQRVWPEAEATGNFNPTWAGPHQSLSPTLKLTGNFLEGEVDTKAWGHVCSLEPKGNRVLRTDSLDLKTDILEGVQGHKRFPSLICSNQSCVFRVPHALKEVVSTGGHSGREEGRAWESLKSISNRVCGRGWVPVKPYLQTWLTSPVLPPTACLDWTASHSLTSAKTMWCGHWFLCPFHRW